MRKPPSMGSKPTWRSYGAALLLSLSLSLLCACAASPMACERPQLPLELNPDPPPLGAYLACEKELETGQTSGPACAALPDLPN